MRFTWILTVAIFCANCVDPDSVSRDEVVRLASPSGGIDAVLVETNGGATTSFGYELYMVRSGGTYKGEVQAASLYGAARNESAYGVNLKWNGPEEIALEYLKARSTKMLQDQVDIGGQQVKVVFRDGIKDQMLRREVCYTTCKGKGNYWPLYCSTIIGCGNIPI